MTGKGLIGGALFIASIVIGLHLGFVLVGKVRSGWQTAAPPAPVPPQATSPQGGGNF